MTFPKTKETWLNEITTHCTFEISNSSVNIFFHFPRFTNDLFCMLVNLLIFTKEISPFYNKHSLNCENISSKKQKKEKWNFILINLEAKAE